MHDNQSSYTCFIQMWNRLRWQWWDGCVVFPREKDRRVQNCEEERVWRQLGSYREDADWGGVDMLNAGGTDWLSHAPGLWWRGLLLYQLTWVCQELIVQESVKWRAKEMWAAALPELYEYCMTTLQYLPNCQYLYKRACIILTHSGRRLGSWREISLASIRDWNKNTKSYIFITLNQNYHNIKNNSASQQMECQQNKN